MELSDLRVFRAVVQEGGVTPAARRLNRVQSNVTTRIRQLEDKLGVALFERVGRRMQLTQAGDVLLSYADRMLALSDEALGAVRDNRPRGIFRLGSMESTAAVRLPEPLADFSERYPEVTLELRTGNPTVLSEALLAGEIEAALIAEPVAQSQFDAIVAFHEEPVIVTLVDHPPIDAPGGTPETILVFEHGCPHRLRMEAWYKTRDEVPARTIELGSYHAMLGCVLAGMGAALLPESVLSTFPESKRLQIHRLPPGEDSLKTLLVWRKGQATPNVRALAAIIGDRTAEQ